MSIVFVELDEVGLGWGAAKLSSKAYDRGFTCERDLLKSSITSRITLATSANASSRLDQVVIGLPSMGNGWQLLNGAHCQSTGRSRIGMKSASPEACLSSARFISGP